MTPELKIACEVVFQEHKQAVQPVKWSRDAFQGRISIGLSEMAKETLVKKNIILWPNRTKKVFTQLNPDVSSAGSFEEAEKIIETKTPGQPEYDPEVYIREHVNISAVPPPVTVPKKMTNPAPIAELKVSDSTWYLKPAFLYFVWPLCGAAGGVLISLAMNFGYSELFRH